MEFILQTDLATALPASIDFNFDVLEAELGQQLEKYKNIVVTEDSVKDAKKDRAALNKLLDAIDSKRKEVKKACLAPYVEFEEQVKRLTSMIRQPITAIDEQVKAFEEQYKEEKRSKIEHFYRTNAKALLDLVPLDKVLPEKWANKSNSLIAVCQEISQKLEKARNDIGIIRAMKLPFEEQMIDKYLQTLDMSEAMAEKSRLEQQQEAVNKVVPPPAPPAVNMTLVHGIPPAAEDAIRCIDFRVFVTEEQKAALRNFFLENGIKYTKVPTDEEGRIQVWQSQTAS